MIRLFQYWVFEGFMRGYTQFVERIGGRVEETADGTVEAVFVTEQAKLPKPRKRGAA